MSDSAAPNDDHHGAATAAGERVVRRGRVAWLTHPPSGTARVEAESHAFGDLPVTLLKSVDHEARPGELLAVAHAMFMAAAVSMVLELEGSPANEIVVEATCTFAGPLPHRELLALGLDVSGRVPGLDAAGFRRLVTSARESSLRGAGARQDLPGELSAKLEAV